MLEPPEDSGAFHCFSKLAGVTALSSTHSEVQALDEVVRITLHVRTILDFLGFAMTEATKIYVDNKSAKDLCSSTKCTHKTSTLNVRIAAIRDSINAGDISLLFVPTALNVADMCTKALARLLLEAHSEKALTGFKGKEVIPEEMMTLVTYLSKDI